MDHKPAHRALTEAPGSPWRADSRDQVPDGRWNQLWRNHLLVEAYQQHCGNRYSDGRLAVVYPLLSEKTRQAVDGYRRLLNHPHHVIEWTLEGLVSAWQPAVTDDQRAWLAAFEDRYLALDLSRSLWDLFKQPESNVSKTAKDSIPDGREALIGRGPP